MELKLSINNKHYNKFYLMIIKKLLIILLIAISTFSYAQTGHYYPADRYSNSLISDLCQDKYGNIWIATDYGLNKFDGYQFTSYLHDDTDSTSICSNAVVELLCDSKGRLWVGTNRGLDLYNDDLNAFIHYKFPADVRPRISDVVELSDGRILFCTAGYGTFVIGEDNVLKTTEEFSADANDKFFSYAYVDSKNRFWKGAYNNSLLMKADGKFHSFVSTVGSPVGIVERADEILIVCLHGIMSYKNGKMQESDIDMSVLKSTDALLSVAKMDSNGNIYIGTRGSGLYYIPMGSHTLERVDVDALGVNLNTAKVWSMLFDHHGNMWLGLQRKGLLMVPLRPLQFSAWSFEMQNLQVGSSITSVCLGDDGIIWSAVQGVGVYGFDRKGHVVAHPKSPAAIEFIFRDRNDNYWVGTDKHLFSYDPLTGKYEQKVTLECDKFNDMTSDASGKIYISVFSRGLCVYDSKTGNLKRYSSFDKDNGKGLLCNDWIMAMTTDHKGMVWMATSSGVSCFDPTSESFLTQGWGQLLNGVMCFSICELKNGNITIGTENGLYLYDRQAKKVDLFPNSESLSNKQINYIVQSNDGDIWCSTTMGIWQYDSESKTFIGHISGNGLTCKEYLYGVGMHSDDDMIYFGNNDGLTVFNPRDVQPTNANVHELMLTAFYVGGTQVNVNTVLNGVRVTEKGIAESDYFELSYLDNTITMQFSQLDFDNPFNVSFEYRVNESDWIKNSAGKNDFTLSHLQSGSYTIDVRALQGNNYSPVKTIKVWVQAPWYLTPLAYLVYFLLLVAFGVYAFIAYRRHTNEQINEEKMKFLINATHDIRSPLTLIMSPLANLKRRIDATVQPDAIRDIDTIEHNANRILNLVNQILDVRKIDKQQMRLHCQETDMVKFVNGIYKMFEYNARERNINFCFNHNDIDELMVWVDRRQFDKVVTNLLSNAFKYSYEGGSVDINLRSVDNNMIIEVADMGVGLEGDNLKRIFDRFYQGGNSRRMHIDGTGIGLNLCKMIIDMHHGTIEAGSRSDGQRGSVFTLTLPLGNAHFSSEEIEKPEEQQSTSKIKQQSAKYRVLIVDDDLEISRYISSELGHFYKFGICSNGKEGLKELLTNEYDLVISDVMMPEMDGFTMLRMIKTNLNISHIPVIMLTSKADVGNRLEGLERGADAFLAKPFNMEELHMNIDNLIHNRQRLKGKYSGAQQQTDKVEQPEVKGNDELLMERIMKAINKNLSDSDFNVDMLTHEVGISRAQLHRKMKEMTGISTSEFIRNIRLEQAARLLREQKINVTQVAYTVGFSNLAHFSTIFRKHFGVSPTEYVDREGKDN